MQEEFNTKSIFAAGPSITKLEIENVLDAVSNGWYENAYYYCEKLKKNLQNITIESMP